MTAIERYFPQPSDIEHRRRYTWDEAHTADRVDPSSVACDSHRFNLRPVETERILEDEVWVCPACGRVSDRIRSGAMGAGISAADAELGWEIAAPYALDSTEVIVISGFATVPPSDDDDDWGHWSVPSFLVEVPFEANGVVKAWPEETDPGKPEAWFRRYSSEFDHWIVAQESILDFVDHMRENGYVVVELALSR